MPVLTEIRGPIAVLTLSRPEARNAWDDDFDEELGEALRTLEQDTEIRCAILTGDEKGGAFSAGANLSDKKTHAAEAPAEFINGLPKWRTFVANLLTDFPKPVIAAVNGYAIGIGCIATFCCDLIVASERAEWRMPQAKLGIMPAYGAVVRLARWTGKGNAMRAALGFSIDSAEAYRIGLAQWLVPHEKLMQKTLEVAGEIASLPPLSARMIKNSMSMGTDMANIRDVSEMDVYRFFALAQSEDAAEAHAAWREKRNPDIKGR